MGIPVRVWDLETIKFRFRNNQIGTTAFPGKTNTPVCCQCKVYGQYKTKGKPEKGENHEGGDQNKKGEMNPKD